MVKLARQCSLLSVMEDGCMFSKKGFCLLGRHFAEMMLLFACCGSHKQCILCNHNFDQLFWWFNFVTVTSLATLLTTFVEFRFVSGSLFKTVVCLSWLLVTGRSFKRLASLSLWDDFAGFKSTSGSSF